MYLCVYLLYCLCLLHDSIGGNGTDQDIKIAELKSLVEYQNTKISDQNMRLLHIKDQDIKIAELKTIIAEFKALIEHQNSKVSDQNTKISDQNIKMCKLDSEIEKLKSYKRGTTETVTPTTTPTSTGATTTTPTSTGATTTTPTSTGATTTTPISSTGATTTTATDTDISSVSGVVFTRWGRADCPESISTSVYNGTTGGSLWSHSGGAVNYVCMPQDPIWDENKHYPGPHWGYLYGGEYKDLPNFAGKSLQEYEVPCSVCRSTAFFTKLMIPGRNTCYPGWTKAYAGELTSGYYKHSQASEYACLDRQSQGIRRKTNSNGVLFFPVRAQCGSLPCPPYQQDALLTCVVCLK